MTESDILLSTFEHSLKEVMSLASYELLSNNLNSGNVTESELFTGSKKRVSDEYPSLDSRVKSQYGFVNNVEGCIALGNILDFLIDSLNGNFLTLDFVLGFNIINILLKNPLFIHLQSLLQSVKAGISTGDRHLIAVCMGYTAMGGNVSAVTAVWHKAVVLLTVCIRLSNSSKETNRSDPVTFLDTIYKFVENYFDLLTIPFDSLMNWTSQSCASIQNINLAKASVMMFNELNLVWKPWSALLPNHREKVHNMMLSLLRSLVCVLWEGEDEEDDKQMQFGLNYIGLPITFEEIKMSQNLFNNSPAAPSIFRKRSGDGFKDATANTFKSSDAAPPSEFIVKLESEFISLFVHVSSYVKNALPLPFESSSSGKWDFFPPFEYSDVLETGSRIYFIRQGVHLTSIASNHLPTHSKHKNSVNSVETKEDVILEGIVLERNIV
ncbi:MAG: hypothetical protein K2X81_03410, partial [Candidatus Obscuribacterales bacterium]|nr:hypothetical protein [Candidatus Obscuribacterales bacterium]